MAELTGQATELVGILTDDDAKIAEGKTAQAEAIEEAMGDSGSKPAADRSS